MNEYRELMEINEAEDVCKKYLEFMHADTPYASKRVNLVDAIETLLFNYHHELTSKDLIAARYMALEAKYSNQWLKDGNDAISREDAIKAIDNVVAPFIPWLNRCTEQIPLKCALALKRLSPVRLKRKEGHFVYKGNGILYCSECDTKLRGEILDKCNYCPTCGAKLREEKE